MNSLPRWVILFFSDFFNGSQVETINRNWHRFSQLSLSNSSREELLREARAILALTEI